MAKALFTKNQQITLLTVYGRNPKDGMRIRARNAIVVSCGQKVATIVDASTGAMIGRNFKPEALAADVEKVGGGLENVRAVLGLDQIEAAEKFAAAQFAAEVAGYDHRASLTQFDSDYTTAMEENAANLRANGFQIER